MNEPTQTIAEIKCHFCDRHHSVDEAIDEGWTPTFWSGPREILKPVCNECQATRLVYDSFNCVFVLRIGPKVIPYRFPL